MTLGPKPVPFVDLTAQTRTLRSELLDVFGEVLDESAFVGGPRVAAFEAAFARFTGTRHAVGGGSGTDALEVALRSLDIGAGDEVIVPAHTFIATPLAVLRAGATPVFVDVRLPDLLIDPAGVERALTPRTRALIPVHLYGQIAPMGDLADVVHGRGIAVVEDLAQAQGAQRDGKAAGTFGAVNATSFYPCKNLGAFGDGGAVVTDDGDLATRCRALRNYGSEVKYEHPLLGLNSRLDPLQAAALQVKLRHLPAWNDARAQAARRYDGLLAEHCDAARPVEVARGSKPVFHLYVVRVPRRDEVRRRLDEEGIRTGIHYPVPCHLQGAMAGLGHTEGDFPVAEAAAKEILSLPMFPEISVLQQVRVVEALARALET
ncbi:MAG: DegT/DnrJ/EryC1/StrS family aminotransferase [Sandaracinaceae bacterium]